VLEVIDGRQKELIEGDAESLIVELAPVELPLEHALEARKACAKPTHVLASLSDAVVAKTRFQTLELLVALARKLGSPFLQDEGGVLVAAANKAPNPHGKTQENAAHAE
jgi:hypothetical protein